MADGDGLPWRHGAKVGAIAWAIGYVTFTVLVALQAVTAGGFANPLVVLAESLLFFLGAHGWPLLVATAAPISLAPIPFLPVPAMLLFAAGYRVATVAGVRWNSRAYRTGATVIAGYASTTVLSLLALVAVTGRFASPALYVLILGFTGLLLPLVAGGFGGIMAAR